jgi:hypothetical protein
MTAPAPVIIRNQGPPATYAPCEITLVSGETATVLCKEEQTWFNTARDNYLEQTKFTEQTDLADLDRLLTLELMVYRWRQYMFSGYDYHGDEIEDEKVIVDRLKYFSDQITKVKESMGLNKKSRDDAANEGSFSTRYADLKARARIFGLHRVKQLQQSLTLMNDLSWVVGTFFRCDEEERRKIGFETEADIVAWIRDVVLPEYHTLDAYFREHEQSYWVRTL